jgi:hypothetical protein
MTAIHSYILQQTERLFKRNFVLSERAYTTVIHVVRVSSTNHTLHSVFNSFKYIFFLQRGL